MWPRQLPSSHSMETAGSAPGNQGLRDVYKAPGQNKGGCELFSTHDQGTVKLPNAVTNTRALSALCKRWRFPTPLGGLERKSTYMNTFGWIDSLLLVNQILHPRPPSPFKFPGVRQLAYGLTANYLHCILQPVVPRMELQKMPHIHAPGILRKLSHWQSAPLGAEAWRNTGVNNLPTSPHSKKGKCGSLCRGPKWVPCNSDRISHFANLWGRTTRRYCRKTESGIKSSTL